MSRRIALLSVLLAVQLVLAGVLMWAAGARTGGDDAFLHLAAADVDALVIRDGDGNQVSLTRDPTAAAGDEAGGWRLNGDLPADAARVEQLLTKLTALQAPWPVATSASSATRFEVAQDKFQRRVELSGGGKLLAEILLGTSPGYRRVHARLAGEDAVFSVDFSTFEVPATADDWLDNDLLAASGEITLVALKNRWQLTRGAEGWLVDGAAASEDAVASLVERLSNLRVMGVAAASDALVTKGTLVIADGAGEQRLDLLFNKAEDQYAVRSDRVSGQFKLASHIAEQVLVDAEALIAATPTATAPGSAPGQEPQSNSAVVPEADSGD